MSAVTQPVSVYVHELINDMKFIGKLPKGYKMCIKSRRHVNGASWPGAIDRWLAGEDYNNTCTFIKETVDKFALMLDSYRHDRKIHDLLMSKALDFRQGIINLIGTYADTPDATSNLETCLAVLDLKIPDDVKHRHGILYPSGVIHDFLDPGSEEKIPELTDTSPAKSV